MKTCDGREGPLGKFAPRLLNFMLLQSRGRVVPRDLQLGDEGKY